MSASLVRVTSFVAVSPAMLAVTFKNMERHLSPGGWKAFLTFSAAKLSPNLPSHALAKFRLRR
jgi:hypothetical protein